MNKHLRTAGMIILLLLSTVGTVIFGAVALEMLWRLITASDSVLNAPAKGFALQFFSPILAILLFRASLHLVRRLRNSSPTREVSL